ncbi:MAG: SH3 domain-containing protein, partial [Firmicutes bacterium]|nr:SH3 domain-containing protein [Bacillota bacterium]
MQTRMQMEMQKKQSRIHIKLVLCLAVVILIFIAMTGFAAGETRTGTVATTALNLRSGPGSNYTSLGLLSINKVVTILDETYDTNGDKWYHVISPAGTEGYVSAKFIEVN